MVHVTPRRGPTRRFTRDLATNRSSCQVNRGKKHPASPAIVELAAGRRHFVTASVRNKVPQAADTASEPRLTIKRGSMTHVHPLRAAVTFGPWATQ